MSIGFISDNYVTISVIRYLTYHFESVTIFNKFILSYEKNSLLNNIIANIDIIKQFKILISSNVETLPFVLREKD